MEVVLAMTIMALLAALGLPFLRPHTGTTAVRTKTAEIVALFRADRNAALRSRSTSTVLVNAETGTIKSTVSSMRIDLPSSISLKLLPAGLAGIQFFGDGRASAARLVISSGNNASAIDINGVTAEVDVSGNAP